MTKNLRPRQAAAVLGIGVSTFWLKARTDPEFPPVFPLGPKTSVVSEADLEAYVAKKKAAVLLARPTATVASAPVKA